AETYAGRDLDVEPLLLSDLELLQWLARWGHNARLESIEGQPPFNFLGQLAELTPHLENGEKELSFTHRLTLPNNEIRALDGVQFFSGRPPLALIGNTFYLLRNAPPPAVLEHWTKKPAVPVRKLSHRLLMQLRKTKSGESVDWEQLCVAHAELFPIDT